MVCLNSFIRIMILIFSIVVSGKAVSSFGDFNDHRLDVSIITETSTPAPGQTITLALKMTPVQGWHGYWSNPGDAGFPNQFDWSLPEGITVSEFEYPAPSPLIISGMMNYIYHGQYVLLAQLHIPENITLGTVLPVVLKVSYLVCNPQSCLPEQQSLAFDLTVGDGKVESDIEERLNHWRSRLPRPLNEKGHFYTVNDDFVLNLPLPSSVDINEAHIYPVTNGLISNESIQQMSHVGDMLTMKTKRSEEVAEYGFQGVLVLNNGTALSFSADPTESSKPVSVIGDVSADKNWQHSDLVLSLVSFLGALLGGVLLNVMPCVFPILSLKIMSITGHESEKSAKVGAVAYALGATLVCVVLGAVILGLRALGHQVGWAFQLQQPIVIACLIMLMSAIGFNLAGLYEVGTLTSGSRLQNKQGPAGDFWTGVLAAFIATPCTGPFMATALGAAMILPFVSALMVFAGLGIGMALPFLLISFIPKLRKRLPKPGQWMITVRRVLALPMFVTVLGLLWVLMRQSTDMFALNVIAAAMFSTFGFWWTGIRQQSQHKRKWLPAIVLTLLPLLLLFYLGENAKAPEMNNQHSADVVVFHKDKLAALRTQHDVFLYFTADWCLTCKVNEKAAIERNSVKEAFNKHAVVSMVGDWTNGESQITKFLNDNGRSGVPLYLWYKKGTTKPEVLPQLLTPQLLIQKSDLSD